MATIKLIAQIEGKGNFPVVDWTNVGAGDGFRLDSVINQAISTLNSKYTLPEGGIPLTDLANGVTSLINGKYSKPSSGIPMSDLSQAVQDAIAAGGSGGYVKPDSGIPSSDMTSAVQTSLSKADTAYQKPTGGITTSDLASSVVTSLGKADTAVQPSALSDYATTSQLNSKYSKPSGGIPSTDLASTVQASLGKAETAVQPSDLSDYATTTQLELKYSKPSGGIPSTDLASTVQASLTKADTALQAHQSLSSYYTAAQTDAAISAATAGISQPNQFKGTVAATTDLPASDNVTGDNYYVTAEEAYYKWNGTSWDEVEGQSNSLETYNARTDGNGVVYGDLKSRLDANEALFNVTKKIESEIGLSSRLHPVSGVTYEQGTIGSDGSPVSSSTLARTSEFIATGSKRITVTVPSGMGVYVFEYGPTKAFIAESGSAKTGTFTYFGGDYVKFVVKHTNSTAVNPAECEKITVLVDSEYANKISELDDAVKNVEYLVNKDKKYTFKPKMELGTYDITNPTNIIKKYSTVRFRTRSPIFVGKKFAKLKFPEGYKIWVIELNDDLEQVGTSGSYITTSPYDYRFTTNYALITIAKTTESSITSVDPENFLEVELETRFDELDMLIEKGALPSGASSWSSSDHLNKCRSAYTIVLNGAKTVYLTGMYTGFVPLDVIAYWYDTNGAYLSYTERLGQAVKDWMGFAVPDNAKYMRFVTEGVTTANRPKTINVKFGGCTEKPQIIKNFKMRADDTEWLLADITDTMYTAIKMLLPSTYSATGAKLPIILWLDGSGTMVTFDNDFGVKKQYLKYLRDEGFAVVHIHGWGSYYMGKYNGCGNAYPYPIPTCRKIYEKGLEYVCDRYNLDRSEVHVMCKSQGGQMATFWASCNDIGARSIGMFAPVVDSSSMPGEALYAPCRAAIAEDLDLQGDVEYYSGTDFLSYSEEAREFYATNKEKILQLNEAYTGLVAPGSTVESRMAKGHDDAEKFWEQEGWHHPEWNDIYEHHEYTKLGCGVPVKIWAAKDDNQTPYAASAQLISQLQNGGTMAILRTMPNGTGQHGAADVGTTRDDVTTALGIEYENIPVGWIENIEFIRMCMAK